jgi:hypothetical protein
VRTCCNAEGGYTSLAPTRGGAEGEDNDSDLSDVPSETEFEYSGEEEEDESPVTNQFKRPRRSCTIVGNTEFRRREIVDESEEEDESSRFAADLSEISEIGEVLYDRVKVLERSNKELLYRKEETERLLEKERETTRLQRDEHESEMRRLLEEIKEREEQSQSKSMERYISLGYDNACGDVPSESLASLDDWLMQPSQDDGEKMALFEERLKCAQDEIYCLKKEQCSRGKLIEQREKWVARLQLSRSIMLSQSGVTQEVPMLMPASDTGSKEPDCHRIAEGLDSMEVATPPMPCATLL